MRRSRLIAVYAAVVAVMLAALQTANGAQQTAGEKAAAQQKQRTLIDVLRSNAPPPQKAIACKQLAVCANQDAVPALAALLADEELASWARIALEVIPGPAADDALREAVASLRGNLLVGAINSIGVRRDVKAVGALIARLKDTDAEVASVAAVALGRVGGAQAVKTLEQSLAGPPAVRSAVAEGCVLCAERAFAQSQPAEAARLYEAVRRADVPQQRILEATRGVILARGTAAVPLLVEQLRSADKARLALGLRVARELAGREVTDALVAELGRATPDRQVLLILALADRRDPAVLPVVLRAAKSGPDQVRSVAIEVLARLGNVACVPVLLDAAMEADAELSQTALTALSDLPGKEVDDELASRLLKAEGKARPVLIQLAGQRQIAATVPILLKAAGDPDGPIRTLALTALGSTIAFSDLPVLIAQVANPAHSEDTAPAERALCAACLRMPDPEACAAKLVAAMSLSSVPARCRFLGILTTLGGDRALRAVGAAAKDSNADIQDAATRGLGEWMTVDAAPVLLDLAKTAEEKYRIRAVRGYIRLARQFFMPDADRATMCRVALQIAQRDAEKKLVLEVIERYPSVDMLRVAIEAIKIPSLKRYAAGIALATAQKVGGRSVDIRSVLAEVGHDPVKVEIIKARYGAGEKFKDVTETLRQHVREFPVIALPSVSYNGSFGGDPAPGVVKQLKIQYRINGKAGEAAFAEDDTIMLPVPK